MDPEIKTLASRASALVGSKTLSEFVVQAIREKANRTIEEAEVVRLNSEAFAAFQAACESPEHANETLTAAMQLHDRISFDSGLEKVNAFFEPV